MTTDLVTRVRDAGIIGAGGAGFPSHIKSGSKAEMVIANGAECEPLAQADQQLMVKHADTVIAGLALLMDSVGASKGIVALKKKYKTAIDSLSMAISGKENIELFLLRDFYPAGDEFVLVHEVTGRVITEGNLPLSEGVVVQNVGTLFNISEAERGIPVTHRHISVLGEVKHPATFRVPVGTAFGDVIAMAGGAKVEEYAMIAGGPMMGRVTFDVSGTVNKTLGMLLVLPKNHPLITLKTRPLQRNIRLIKSACTQCSYCTELCPRYLLGHSLQPHKIMRSLDYGNVVAPDVVTSAAACSGCGLCETYACVQGLSPRQVNMEIRAELAKRGYRHEPQKVKVKARQEMEHRKVPSERLLSRLGLEKYKEIAPLKETPYSVRQVKIGLRQHIGAPAVPVVEEGDVIRQGDLIADIPDGYMGAKYHASVSGRVQRIGGGEIVIEAA
ncbi:MAG: SLBB domain-containing protein [Alphaproteobacteria bacterium]|uniref:SLBB domain-containing protein n=1 Tax=Candidatus Nitrobium versatile TaxID=2884831 RepID=A0A953J2E9_9BACT|nr:SLBB domain-containing protein [Candidatus Nitrobium versatile]